MALVDIPGIGTFADDNQRDFPGEQWSRPMIGVFYDNPPPTLMDATDIRDLADEEIQFLADSDQFTGKPIRYDHQDGTDCGKIDRVWREGRTWMVEFRLDQSTPAGRCLTKRIRSGLTPGLSLQHQLESRRPVEISVCQRGARPNTRVVQASDTPATDNTEQLARRARLNRLFRMCVAALTPTHSVAASDTMDYGGSYNGPRTVTRHRPESDAPVMEAPRTEKEWEQEYQLMKNQLRKVHGVVPKFGQFGKSEEQKRQELFEQAQNEVLAEKASVMGQHPQIPPQYSQIPPQSQQQQYSQIPSQYLQPQFSAPLSAPPPAPKASDGQLKWPDGFTDEQKEKWLEQNYAAALEKNPVLRQQKELLDKGVSPQGGGPKILQGEEKAPKDKEDTEMTPVAESKKDKEPTETERILAKRLRELEEKDSKREFAAAFERLCAVKGRDLGSGDTFESLKQSYEELWNSGEIGQKTFLNMVSSEEKAFGRKHGKRRGRDEAEEAGDEDGGKPSSRSPSVPSAADTSKIGYQDFMRMAEKAREQKLDSLAPPPPAPSGVTVAASAPNSLAPYQDRLTRIQASHPMLGRMPGTLDTLAFLSENPDARRASSTQFIRRGRNGEPIFAAPSDFDKTGGKGLWEPNSQRVLQGARVRFADMYNMDGSLKSQ